MFHSTDKIEYSLMLSEHGVVLTIWVTTLYELCYHLPSPVAAWERLNQHLANLGQSSISYETFTAQVGLQNREQTSTASKHPWQALLA